jgi:hypothetical protein
MATTAAGLREYPDNFILFILFYSNLIKFNYLGWPGGAPAPHLPHNPAKH